MMRSRDINQAANVSLSQSANSFVLKLMVLNWLMSVDYFFQNQQSSLMITSTINTGLSIDFVRTSDRLLNNKNYMTIV